jgi:NhaP-type Na+/H+ or K+/H+ antiporter
MTHLSAQSLSLAVGVSALVTVICRKFRFPALLPLLLVGLGLGTSGVGLIDGASLGDALKGFVTVSIGLLIFEGALHLNREEMAHAPRAVWGLLTVGAITTWVGAAAAAHWLLGLSFPIAAILGAALIVTGPTVVQPVLRLVRLSPKLHAALAAEAVLIDPIGVVATVTTLEVVRQYMQVGPDLHIAGWGFWMFLKPLLGGAGVGVVAGLAGRTMLKFLDQRGRPDPQILNLLAIGLCMTCVGVGEAFASEAGLVAVTICGIFVARARVLGATELRAFKELLAAILVGTLFVLLSSRFQASSVASITGREIAFVAALVLLVRPACVWISTWRSKLSWQERAFASLFAPRGIVALSVVAIAAAEMTSSWREGGPATGPSALEIEAARLEPTMFLVIVVTVLIATTLSPLLSWLLGIRAGRGNALILVGAHALSRALARTLGTHDVRVRIIDRNPYRVGQAMQEGLDAVAGDATDTRWLDDAGAPHDAGWVLAWTGNDDVDRVAARWGEERFGDGHALLWSDKPARDVLARLDLGGGRTLSTMVDRLESGDSRIADAATPAELDRLLAWIEGGVLTMAAPGAKPPETPGTRRFIGIRDVAERLVPPPAPAATAESAQSLPDPVH